MGCIAHTRDFLGDGMTVPEFMSNAKGHLGVINRHKLAVAKNCFRLGLYKQGICHDLSKYAPEEFLVGVRYFQGTRSPNTAERDEKGYSRAWMHHKGRNKHHFEYWIDQKANRDGRFEGKPMPTRYVCEMFCDRVAACKVYQGNAYTDRSAYDYFMLEQSLGNVLIHPDTAAFLGWMLELLMQEGEDYAFSYIRTHVVEARFVYGQGGSFE